MNTDRIMIFGAVATGKSTFGQALSRKLSIPCTHLDALQKQFDRERDLEEIRNEIVAISNQDRWIIEGNAFRKDPTYRIDRSTLILFFPSHPIKSLMSYCLRWLKNILRPGHIVGGATPRLKFTWITKHIFNDYPPREKAALEYIDRNNKPLLIIKNRQQAKDLLESF